jgi:hypothetical protein
MRCLAPRNLVCMAGKSRFQTCVWVGVIGRAGAIATVPIVVSGIAHKQENALDSAHKHFNQYLRASAAQRILPTWILVALEAVKK